MIVFTFSVDISEVVVTVAYRTPNTNKSSRCFQGFPRVTTGPVNHVTGVYQNLAGRLGPGQEVFGISREGSGWVGSGGFQISRGRAGSSCGHDPTGMVWYAEKRCEPRKALDI